VKIRISHKRRASIPALPRLASTGLTVPFRPRYHRPAAFPVGSRSVLGVWSLTGPWARTVPLYINLIGHADGPSPQQPRMRFVASQGGNVSGENLGALPPPPSFYSLRPWKLETCLPVGMGAKIQMEAISHKIVLHLRISVQKKGDWKECWALNISHTAKGGQIQRRNASRPLWGLSEMPVLYNSGRSLGRPLLAKETSLFRRLSNPLRWTSEDCGAPLLPFLAKRCKCASAFLGGPGMLGP
jgi:hypothetical protein